MGLVLVLAAAVAVRVAFLSNDPPLLLTTDSLTYALPANQVAHGMQFDLSQRRTPGYPLFLAALWATFGDHFHPVVYAQHLLGIATAGLTWILGRIVFGRIPALLGGLAIALSGPQIIYEHYLMTEALFTFLLLVATVTSVVALSRKSEAAYVLAGALFGLCALTRPIGQAFPFLFPLVVLGGVTVHPFSSRARLALRAGLLALIGFTLVVLPWMTRNWVLGGELTGSSALGKTLFGRITRHDDGFRFDLAPHWPTEADPRRADALAFARQAAQADTSRGSLVHQRLVQEFGYGEAEAYNVMRDAAVGVLLTQPGYYVRSSLGAAIELFQGQEEPLRVHLERLANPRLRRDWQQAPELSWLLPAPVPPEVRVQTLNKAVTAVRLYQPSNDLVAPLLSALFLGGTLAILRRPVWRAAVMLPFLTLTIIVLSAFLDGPVARFRYPVDPLIALTAAGGLVAVVDLAKLLVERQAGTSNRAGEKRPLARLIQEPNRGGAQSK